MAKVKKAIKALKKSVPKKSVAKKSAAKSKGRMKLNKKPVLRKKHAARVKAKFHAPQSVVAEKPAALIGKGNKYLSAELKRELRNKLVRLREHITGQINFLAADNLNRSQKDSEIDFRSEGQGTDNFDRDFALNRVSLEQDIVFEIDEALSRIKIGTYGACENCGKPVEKARIVALPYSRMCISCQSKLEVGHKKFRSFETTALFPNADKTAPEVASEEE